MARGKTITADTPIVAPALLARHLGISPEKLDSVAKQIGVEFTITPTRRSLASFRDSVRLARHLAQD